MSSLNSIVAIESQNQRLVFMRSRFNVLVAIPFLLANAAPVIAADDDDDVFIDPQQLANQQQFVLTPEQFDQWVFNGVGNYEQAMKQLDSQINMRIEAINRVCKLSDEQKHKLHVAASTDI